jgi:predicted ATP-binding protein involved in virulence
VPGLPGADRVEFKMDNMHIQSITLKNYRMFRDFTCDFDSGMTVLVADNGGGKTTVLDAIRVALGPYFSQFPKGKDFGIAASDVYCFVSRENPTYRNVCYPATIEVEAELDEPDLPRKWLRALNSEKSKTTIKDADELLTYANLFAINALGRDMERDWHKREQEIAKLEWELNGAAAALPVIQPSQYETADWPLLAYYGTGRLWVHKKLPEKNVFADGFDERSVGYADCMNPASSYQSVSLWLRHAERIDFEAKLRFSQTNPAATAQQMQAFEGPFASKLRGIRRAVDTLLEPSGWGDISWSTLYQEATLTHKDFGILPVSQLSDGIRNSVGLIMDLACRAVQLNPHLGERAVQAAYGVVLIDEVDMHLHPSWQQTILSSLRAAFPKIQFIVTTHSPQVLSTVRRENIRLITRGDTGFVASMPTMSPLARAAGDVLAHVMNVDVRPPLDEILDTVRAYEHLVRQKKIESPEALAVKAGLEAVGYEIPAADLALWTFLGAQVKEGRHG